MAYQARFTERNTSNTITLKLDASTDTEAVAEVDKIVADGFRNETQCNVELSDGRIYGASNRHGNAVGNYA